MTRDEWNSMLDQILREIKEAANRWIDKGAYKCNDCGVLMGVSPTAFQIDYKSPEWNVSGASWPTNNWTRVIGPSGEKSYCPTCAERRLLG